jgi:hypothetical protein
MKALLIKSPKQSNHLAKALNILYNPHMLLDAIDQSQAGVERMMVGSSALCFPTLSAFLAYLDNKDVIDIGSGYNNLAIGLALRKKDARVTSINPRYMGRDHYWTSISDLSTFTEDYLRRRPSRDQVIQAAEVSLNTTYTCMAHQLSMPDCSYDLAVDTYALTQYIRMQALPPELAHLRKQLYKQSATEVMRVLRRNGRWLIGGASLGHPNGDIEGDWRVQTLREMGLRPRIYTRDYPNSRHQYTRVSLEVARSHQP